MPTPNLDEPVTCKRGHTLTDDNIYRSASGRHRECLTCRRMRERARTNRVDVPDDDDQWTMRQAITWARVDAQALRLLYRAHGRWVRTK